jgi:hypothetical protein
MNTSTIHSETGRSEIFMQFCRWDRSSRANSSVATTYNIIKHGEGLYLFHFSDCLSGSIRLFVLTFLLRVGFEHWRNGEPKSRLVA